jgi:polysaccharide pyruvyl transferase WcaK-like protein
MNPPTLGLLGLYRCGNIGDEAIWRAFVDAVRAARPDVRLRMIAYGPGGLDAAPLPDDPRAVDELLHHLALDDPRARRVRWGWWLRSGLCRLVRELRDLDAVWYAGGHWLHDLSLVTLAGVLAPPTWARLRGKSGGFVNVGAGPLDGSLGRFLARRALPGRGPLVVRDEHSAAVLRAAGAPEPRIAADTAYLLDPAPAAEIDAAWNRLNLPPDVETIGLVPCAWFKLADLYRPRTEQVDRMVDALADLARGQAKAGRCVLLLPTMLPEDDLVARRIAAKCDLPGVRVAPTGDWPARVLLGLIGRLRALVSFRMHPLLFAYRMGTPLVALNYAPKVESLMADLNLSRWLAPLDEAWPQTLAARLDALLADPDPLAGATPLEVQKEKARAGIDAALATLTK